MADGPEPVTAALTSRDVLRALYGHYTPRYAMLTEFVTTTLEDTPTGDRFMRRWVERRIDALLISKTERIGIEVKVTRADFLQDVRRPEKQAPWQALTHRFAYACPTGLVKPDEVPAGCGLIEIDPVTRAVKWTVRAPKKTGPTLPLNNRLTWAATIRLAQAEARLKGYHPGYTEGTDNVDDLKARIVDLEREIVTLAGRAVAEHSRAARWQKIAGAHGALLCKHCGQKIRIGPARSYEAWVHADKTLDRVCEDIRDAAMEAAKAAAPDLDGKGWKGYIPVPPIEPKDPET